MLQNLQFKTNQILFHQGDPSDRVLQVLSGEVEILREVDGDAVVLGHVCAGEWLGEMGVIEHRSRSATARAATDGAAEVLTAQQFLDRFSSDPALARELILRLSIRLKRIEDKVAGDLLPLAHEHPDTQEAVAATAPISIAAGSSALRAQMGTTPVDVDRLPFVIGRMPRAGEALPLQQPDLVLVDQQPFRLSRDHFMLVRRGSRLFVSDLGSTLGTIVNGQGIGHHFMRDAAALKDGENRIIAGGRGSPFEFLVSVVGG